MSNVDLSSLAYPCVFTFVGPTNDPIKGESIPENLSQQYIAGGLSKYELYAAMAMQGLLSFGRPVSPNLIEQANEAAALLCRSHLASVGK